MSKYSVEFILTVTDISLETINNSLIEFAQNLEVSNFLAAAPVPGAQNFKISLIAEDPAIIFDICCQFGRLKSVKVNEAGVIK